MVNVGVWFQKDQESRGKRSADLVYSVATHWNRVSSGKALRSLWMLAERVEWRGIQIGAKCCIFKKVFNFEAY